MIQQNDKCFLVHQEDERDDKTGDIISHNKVWSYEIIPKNGRYTVRTAWGRLGTTGQSKDFEYSDAYSAKRHAEDKMWEKIRKGYNKVVAEELELLVARAKIVGPKLKVEQLEFVAPDLKKSGFYCVVRGNAVADPAYVVSVWCRVNGEGKHYDILASSEDCILFEMGAIGMLDRNWSTKVSGDCKFTITKPRQLSDLTEDKVAKQLLERISPIVVTLF